MSAADGLARLVAERYAELLALARRRAGGALLRVETAEDLAQGISAHALAQGSGAHVPEAPADAAAWLFRVAENYLHDRRDHWAALKRSGSRVLRAGLADADGDSVAMSAHAASVTGPSTFAVRREQLQLAACALDLLLPRDRELVNGVCAGLAVDEQARSLGLSYDAAVAARGRALERLRSCFRIVRGGTHG